MFLRLPALFIKLAFDIFAVCMCSCVHTHRCGVCGGGLGGEGPLLNERLTSKAIVLF